MILGRFEVPRPAERRGALETYKNGRRGNRFDYVPCDSIVLFSPTCDRFPNFAFI